MRRPMILYIIIIFILIVILTNNYARRKVAIIFILNPYLLTKILIVDFKIFGLFFKESVLLFQKNILLLRRQKLSFENGKVIRCQEQTLSKNRGGASLIDEPIKWIQ